MVNILIKTESHYRVNRRRIRNFIEKMLKERLVKTSTEISINVVGDRLMKSLNKKYRNLDQTTVVLAFPMSEKKEGDHFFVSPPDGILRLGDIVISYPQARNLAADENMLMDDKIDELIEHGMNNLLS